MPTIIATKKQQSISNYRFIVISSRVLSIAVLSGAIAVCVCVTFPLLYAVQDVAATLFDERGRVVSSSCHAVPRGRSVDLDRVRKLEFKMFDELGRK